MVEITAGPEPLGGAGVEEADETTVVVAPCGGPIVTGPLCARITWHIKTEGIIKSLNFMTK
jgi:hypothetical protein